MTGRTSAGRIWAMAVLILAGSISVSFNTVHAFQSTHLPWPLATLYGVGPVLLAALQSHTVALNVARAEPVGRFRLALTFGLVVAGLGLSFLGVYDLLQHAVPDPISATPFNEPAVAFPITIDLMALAALHELLRSRADGAPDVPPGFARWIVPAALLPASAPAFRGAPGGVPEWARDALDEFADDLAGGQLPSQRVIKDRLSVGSDRAAEVQAFLRPRIRS